MQADLSNEAISSEEQLPALFSYIDQQRVVPAIDRGNYLRDPNTRAPLQRQLSSSTEQVEAALVASARAFAAGEWENTPAAQRADTLDRIADTLAAAPLAEQIARADALTTGAVISVTRRMATLAPLVFRAAANYLRDGHLEQTVPGKAGDVLYTRRPWGPALLVTPWNGPTAIGSHKIASALAAGAPCIAKPSEWAPHSTLLIANAVIEAGLPEGVFQLTCGSRQIGAQMLEDPRIAAVSFTGGTAGGQVVANACARRFAPTQLELGGNNPLVVFEDADLDKATAGIVYGLTNLNAQWCRALGRLLVHHSVREALLERVADALAQVRLGHSLDESANMGPLIHEQQYQSVQSHISRLDAAGGRILQYSALPGLPGYFVPPTLVDGCNPHDTSEEIFGPVACIHGFDTEAEALALANGTAYGLAAYVYSNDLERAQAFSARLRTGGVKINGYSLLSLCGEAPRGAWGISGLGEEGTAQSIEFFTGSRVVGLSAQDPLPGRCHPA